MDIIESLDRLANLQAQLDVIQLRFNELRKTIIPADIQQQLDDLAAEEQTAIETAQTAIAQLEAEIKTAVLQAGQTVKGEHLSAVFTRGRVSWDTKALDGYATAHPEILIMRKEGVPSVSIRKVG